MNDYLERVQRGADFIETRLDEELPLVEVARAASISQWHFQRIFKALTGETLKTYIRSRRMANALDRLLTTKLRILDIALSAGFDSQESFARAFKSAFGLTPQQYRDIGKQNLFLKKIQFDSAYLEHLQHNVSLNPEIQACECRQLVGMRTAFFGVDSEKNNVGAKLPSLWAKFQPRMTEIPGRVLGCGYGVVRQDLVDTEQLVYHAAVEVTALDRLPEDMEAIEVPAATYAKFAHRGPAREIDHTVNYIYSTWLANCGARHTYGPDLEIYGSEYHPTSADSVIYYAIPIAD